MDFIGFDLGKVSSQVCIITEGGELSERRIPTDREQIGKLLGGRPRARILIEASTESEWVARFLEGLGHEVVVADTNFAPMYATRSRRVKTDKRDARTLAVFEVYYGAWRIVRFCDGREPTRESSRAHCRKMAGESPAHAPPPNLHVLDRRRGRARPPRAARPEVR